MMVLVAACHDARRANPLDPDLTPPVQDLAAGLDQELGVVLLQWRAYDGAQPFAGYCVLRNQRGRVEVDTLARIEDRAQTTYLDTSVRPDAVDGYDYRVEVVNAAGFANPSDSRSVAALVVTPAALQSLAADSLRGLIHLRWQRYRGPGFGGYEVWRSRFGLASRRLAQLATVDDTTWADTSAVPGEDYLYRLRTAVFGDSLDSPSLPAGYPLPAVQLARTQLSSATACAELEWSTYAGPRFTAYEVWRRAPRTAVQTVAIATSPDSTTFSDCQLEGNTPYSYSVFVRTGFTRESAPGATDTSAVGVQSLWRTGRFYGRQDVLELPISGSVAVQAMAIALDDDDVLIAASLVSTTTADNMQPGIHVSRPASQRAYTRLMPKIVPAKLSPLRVAAAPGRLFIAVTDTSGQIQVGAVETEGAGFRELWTAAVPSLGEYPAGLYLEPDGTLVLVDDAAMTYGIVTADATQLAPSDRLRESRNDLPIYDVVFAAGEGAGVGLDQFFLLAPGRDDRKVVGTTRVSPIIYGGNTQFYDSGVGLDPGQSFDPLALAFDSSRARLVMLESRGLVQVADADKGTRGAPGSPYITRWGSWGTESGEFLFNPRTTASVVVDSQGRIYVTDAAVAGGRVQIFAP